MQTRKHLSLAALCGVMVALHLATVLTGTEFYLTQLTMAAYYGLVIIGLGVLMGYAGQISIGHAGFFAIGGYLAAGLTTRNLEALLHTGWGRGLDQMGLLVHGQDLYGATLVTVTPWLACVVAVCTGHGLKDPDIITQHMSPPAVLPPNLGALEDILKV